MASINGDTNVFFGLENVGVGEGISMIGGTDFNTSIQVSGYNAFIVGAGKSTYTVASENTAGSFTSLYYNNDSSRMEVKLSSGDAYTIDGGKALFF